MKNWYAIETHPLLTRISAAESASGGSTPQLVKQAFLNWKSDLRKKSGIFVWLCTDYYRVQFWQASGKEEIVHVNTSACLNILYGVLD